MKKNKKEKTWRIIGITSQLTVGIIMSTVICFAINESWKWVFIAAIFIATITVVSDNF